MGLSAARRCRVHLSAKIQAERIFNRYKRVVFSAARRVAKTSGRPVAEMIEEGLAKLGEMASDWGNPKVFDRTKCSACTWIYTKVYWHLKEYVARSCRKREVGIPDDNEYVARSSSWIERFLQELSDEAKALVEIVIEAPGELTRAFRSESVHARLALLEHLQQQKWSEELIDLAWTEVQSSL